jgi:hypothetical protein
MRTTFTASNLFILTHRSKVDHANKTSKGWHNHLHYHVENGNGSPSNQLITGVSEFSSRSSIGRTIGKK